MRSLCGLWSASAKFVQPSIVSFFLPISHVNQFLDLKAFAPAKDMPDKRWHKPLYWHGF
jgi:hypothetical protein